MITFIALLLVLHPGHMTRVEIRGSDDAKSLEVAMRIDASDLESALKVRFKKAFDVEALSDDDAKKLLSDYLRSTITANGQKLSEHQFRYVGWERKTRYAWVYFELQVPVNDAHAIDLRMRTLFEVEPAIQHVVVLAENIGNRSEILLSADQAISIKRSP